MFSVQKDELMNKHKKLLLALSFSILTCDALAATGDDFSVPSSPVRAPATQIDPLTPGTTAWFLHATDGLEGDDFSSSVPAAASNTFDEEELLKWLASDDLGVDSVPSSNSLSTLSAGSASSASSASSGTPTGDEVDALAPGLTPMASREIRRRKKANTEPALAAQKLFEDFDAPATAAASAKPKKKTKSAPRAKTSGQLKADMPDTRVTRSQVKRTRQNTTY